MRLLTPKQAALTGQPNGTKTMRESTTATTTKLCVNNLAFYLSNTRRTNEEEIGEKEEKADGGRLRG